MGTAELNGFYICRLYKEYNGGVCLNVDTDYLVSNMVTQWHYKVAIFFIELCEMLI